jgi:ComF family protein
VRNLLASLFDLALALIEVLYRNTCAACGGERPLLGRPLCSLCAATFVAIAARGCRKCGSEPLGRTRAPARCRRCREREFAFRRAVAALRYGAAVRAVILAIKFERRREAIPLLAGPMAAALREAKLDRRVDVVVAVPLHPLRRYHRGFDQSECLAAALAARLALPHVEGALLRHRFTSPQSLRRRRERSAALDGAYVALRRRRIRGKTVLLVDDVMTSGATADAAARALLRGGARRVYVAVAAT